MWPWVKSFSTTNTAIKRSNAKKYRNIHVVIISLIFGSQWEFCDVNFCWSRKATLQGTRRKTGHCSRKVASKCDWVGSGPTDIELTMRSSADSYRELAGTLGRLRFMLVRATGWRFAWCQPNVRERYRYRNWERPRLAKHQTLRWIVLMIPWGSNCYEHRFLY